jgi:glycerate 2-kinase
MSMSANPPSRSRARADLMRIYAAAVAAVAPHRVIAQALSGMTPGAGSVPAILARANGVRLLAVGKAALGMAAEAEHRIGDRLIEGLVIAPAGSDADTANSALIAGGAIAPVGGAGNSGAAALRSRAMLAAHPLPDESSVTAAHAALELARRATPGELVILALSGGASALIAAPSGGVTLADKIAISGALMRAGANIRELNTVRKHLSAIKGGRLLAATAAGVEVLSLILSDVPGETPLDGSGSSSPDDPSKLLATIGSGPTAADPTSYTEAIGVLKRRRLWGRAPETIRDHLERGAAGEFDETLKPGDAALTRVTNVIIGDNRMAVDAAAQAATALGYRVERGRELDGEADELGRQLAHRVSETRGERVCVLAGGEPVVTVKGDGRGGRSQQAALAMAIELASIAATRTDLNRVMAMFAGTDGIDGPTDAAGAIVTPETVARAIEARVDPHAALIRNDAYEFFKALGDLVIVGPTGTNVADIFVALVNY